MPTKRQRRKRRRRIDSAAGGGAPAAQRASDGQLSAVARDDAQPAKASARRGAPGKAPQALWGSFPLSELVVLIGLILLVAGFFVSGMQGLVMMVVGGTLGALAGLELAAREHFSGYRSHNILLSAAAAMIVFVPLVLATSIPPMVCLVAGALVFGGSAWLFTSAFRRASGGALYRIKGG